MEASLPVGRQEVAQRRAEGGLSAGRSAGGSRPRGQLSPSERTHHFLPSRPPSGWQAVARSKGGAKKAEGGRPAGPSARGGPLAKQTPLAVQPPPARRPARRQEAAQDGWVAGGPPAEEGCRGSADRQTTHRRTALRNPVSGGSTAGAVLTREGEGEGTEGGGRWAGRSAGCCWPAGEPADCLLTDYRLPARRPDGGKKAARRAAGGNRPASRSTGVRRSTREPTASRGTNFRQPAYRLAGRN